MNVYFAKSSFLSCVFPFELWIFSVVHLRLALLCEVVSFARRESPGRDWLRAPLIRVGTIYPPRIGYIGQFRELVLFLPLVRVSWARSFVLRELMKKTMKRIGNYL